MVNVLLMAHVISDRKEMYSDVFAFAQRVCHYF